jgi:hypothetical protein
MRVATTLVNLDRKRLKHMIENGDEPPVPLKLGRVSSE